MSAPGPQLDSGGFLEGCGPYPTTNLPHKGRGAGDLGAFLYVITTLTLFCRRIFPS